MGSLFTRKITLTNPPPQSRGRKRKKMIKKYLVESMTDDMPTRVHYNGTFQPGDVAFCGADLMGDNHLGWHAAIETDRRVDCEACIRQLKHAKAILSQNKNNPS